jgi:hypothetical protein
VSDDPYEVLGVDPHADDDEIRRVYRELAMRWHPDRAGTDTTFVFQKLAAAYAVLADPATRAAHDRKRGIRRAATDRREPPAEPAPMRRRAPGVLLRRLSSPLNILLACGIARRAEDDVVELRLEPDEAAQGGMVTIPMRVPVRRPDSPDAPVVEELFSAWLAIPPGVADGTTLQPSVLLPGMLQPVVFRVRLA